MTKRECGSCSLCCKLMGVPEVKENHQWCPHAAKDKGCTIYPHRPERCRDFHCQWLFSTQFPDYWYPLKSKIIIDARAGPPRLIYFIVDPAYPNRWREEPFFSDIKHIAKAGHDGRLGQTWATLVMIKDEKIPIIATAALVRSRTSAA